MLLINPIRVSHLYSMLRGIASPPNPRAIAKWLTIIRYSQCNWHDMLMIAGLTAMAGMGKQLKELEENTGINLDELKPKDPKSIALVLDSASRDMPKPERPHTLTEERLATASEPVVEDAPETVQENEGMGLEQPISPEVSDQQITEAQIATEIRAPEPQVQDRHVLERVSYIGISSDMFNCSARCLAVLIKCGLMDKRLSQLCMAEADNLVRSLNIPVKDRAGRVIEVAELLGESANQLVRTIEFTLREVEVDEGELEGYCPSCASRLYEVDEGKVCGKCCLVYKPRNTEVIEAWRLYIPRPNIGESSLLVVILENFPYFIPARFSAKIKGYRCSVYRIDESGRKGVDEDEIVDRLSQRVARDIGLGIIPVLIAVRYGWDPRANEYRYIERMAKVVSSIIRNPSLLMRNDRLLVSVVPRSVLSKDTAQTFLGILDKEGISYATYSYVIDEGDVVRRLIGAGLDHREAYLLIDLVKAFPRIMDRLRQSDKPLPDRIRDYLEKELGEEYGFIADACAEALRLGRKLTVKEARRATNPCKAFREDILKSLGLID